MAWMISELHSAWKPSTFRIHQIIPIFHQPYSDQGRFTPQKPFTLFLLTGKHIEMEKKILQLQNVPEHVELAMELVGLINKHYHEQRSLKFYANALSIKTTLLNKHCKRILRKSVYELVQDKVHEEAIKLLAYTDWPIKRISYEVGCSDPGYFNRCFKKKTGYSPKKYRLSGLGMEYFEKTDR